MIIKYYSYVLSSELMQTTFLLNWPIVGLFKFHENLNNLVGSE